jgi:hypothetical protein
VKRHLNNVGASSHDFISFPSLSVIIELVSIFEQFPSINDDFDMQTSPILSSGPLKKHGASATLNSLIYVLSEEYLSHTDFDNTQHSTLFSSTLSESTQAPSSTFIKDIQLHLPLGHSDSECLVEHASQLNHSTLLLEELL